jgi:hypothetical protein
MTIMKLGAMRDVLQGVEIDTGVKIEKLALGIHDTLSSPWFPHPCSGLIRFW